MRSFDNVNRVPLLDNEGAVPSGSIWLGPVDPSDVIVCSLRVRPGPGMEPSPADGLLTGDVHHRDHDSQNSVRGEPAADPYDLDAVRDFVNQVGLDVLAVHPERRTVEISGAAAAVADAFQVRLGRYKHDGEVRVGYVAPLYLPSTIADIVEEISGLENSSPDPLPSATPSYWAWRITRRQFVIPLLALAVGCALGVFLYARLTPERSLSSQSTIAQPPQSFLPSPPVFSQRMLQEPETAGWRSLEAGRLQEAQDYFLRALAVDPSRPKAMQGLVAVTRRMARDDPQVIRKQMALYQDAIQRGGAPGEYYTPPALELLVSASQQAIRELRAQDGPAALSTPAPTRSIVPNPPGPPPPSPRTQDPATRQPPHPAASSAGPIPARPAARPLTQPTLVPSNGQDSSTVATAAPASVAPQTREPVVTPLPQPPPVTASPSSNPPAPTPDSALQAPPPPPVRLYTVRIGPVADDRAAVIANRLSVGGFSQARLGTQTGYRVVSDPLPPNDAQSVVAALAGQGIRGDLGTSTGGTVQVVFGTFGSQRDAKALADRVIGAGYHAQIRAGTVYTLLLGPYPSLSVNTITDIVKAGDPEAVVAADPVP